MSLKFTPALAGLSLLSLVAATGAGLTPAAAARCGHAPKCDHKFGAALHECRAERASAEADCQRRGKGYDRETESRRVPGKGRKYHKCKDKERRENRKAAQFDDATSMADCD